MPDARQDQLLIFAVAILYGFGVLRQRVQARVEVTQVDGKAKGRVVFDAAPAGAVATAASRRWPVTSPTSRS